MNVRKIRPEDKDFIINNWDNLSVSEIATSLGVSDRTLARWAATLGMPKKQLVRTDTFERRTRPKRVTEMYVHVKKCCVICEHYNTCPSFENGKIDPCKMVCFDFEVNKVLAINDN